MTTSHPVQLQPRRPLTPSQELIWTSQRLQPDAPHQNMALITSFGAPVDPERFLTSVDAVIARSDALRTTVREIDGVPHPAVSAVPPNSTKLVRLGKDALEKWMQERLATPLDIATCAYESVLLDHGEGEWSWWMNAHHIVIDAASSANLFTEVAATYHGEEVASPTYADVWAEFAEAENSPRFEKARDHWATADVASPPTSMYRPDSGPTTLADRVQIDMQSGRQDALDALLADRFRLLSPDLSLTVALATAIAVYLSRLGNDAVTIGIPIHHRSTKSAKTVIGPLVELFPLKIAVTDDDTFATLHGRVGKGLFELLRHALPGTSPRQNFDVVLNVHGATMGSFGSIPASTRWIHPGHVDPHHRLRVQALDYDGSGTLEIALDINHRIADGDHRQRSATHLAVVLDAMTADPDQSVHSVSLVGDDEQLLLTTLVDNDEGVPLDGVTPDIIQQRLRDNRDVPTLQDDAVCLTADEVDQRIDGVARRLSAAGFGRGDLIAIEMPIGIDAVVAIHAVLRAGAAFVPVDPTYPEARREHIRTDSKAVLTLRSIADLDEFPLSDSTRPEIEPDDLAYVIYTSGSTGLPKGVPITHRGLSEYLGFAHTTYVGSEPPVMPLFTSLSFDLTITTLFLPFLAGGRMTVHPAGGLPALREIVDQRQATVLKATPSHLELLVRMLDAEHPLQTVIVGGEAFMSDLADRLLAATDGRLVIINEYGPTEVVVGCMEHRYDPTIDTGAEVPIGRPGPGVALHVLDRFGLPVPIGVSGELYLHRPGMTLGYLDRPDLSDSKLGVAPGTGSSQVLYRTGDMVRLLDVNRMVFLGRIDEQVKVAGIRLEPGEIEHVAQQVPGVLQAVAGLWSPDPTHSPEHCVRCGLSSDVPSIVIDGDGVCSSCHQYELVAPQADAWFRTEDDLVSELDDARQRSSGSYDVLHLLSGGKDSTYALHRLVELGARVFSITLDNGFISEVAKANVRRATAALGVDHEFVTVEGMNEIFRDSLERFSNVCNGCYKAIYTVALARAEELGIPAIVTGLSRGQFFETRLVPGMFESERFDSEKIDDAVREARRVYHNTPDAVSEVMDVAFLEDGTIFDRITFIDFYRYVDVELREMYLALEANGTWQRPPDTGRSTNCLINSAGIHVHKIETGHHNYAEPYSWDVRLGHKTRDEALFELDDPMDDEELAAITSMLAEVGYEPRKPEMLTLWVEASDELDVAELRDALAAGLPSHAVPRSIEIVEAIPLTPNGKVDKAALPAPALRRSSGVSSDGRVVESPTEDRIAAIWNTVLGLDDVRATDDFFALGGTSLHALEMIVRVSDQLGIVVPESIAFTKRTIAELALHVDDTLSEAANAPVVDAYVIPSLTTDVLPLSPGEEAMLYEWRRDQTDIRYNVGWLYTVPVDLDIERFDAAVRMVVEHQPTLHTSYGPSRRTLATDAALWIGHGHGEVASISKVAQTLHETQFDLVNGPLISVHHVSSDHPDDQDRRGVLLRTHHIVSDVGSMDVMWSQIDRVYRGLELNPLDVSYAAHSVWQRERSSSPIEVWSAPEKVGELLTRSVGSEPDGYVHRDAPITMSELRMAPGTTPFSSALTALSAVVAAYHDDPVFELTMAASVRDHPSLVDVVGYFLNPLPILITIDPTETITSLAESVSGRLAHALEHRNVPFASLVRSARDRGIAPPLGRVMLSVEDLAPSTLDGAPVEREILASGVAVNDLTFFVQVRGEQVELGCEYRGSTVGRQPAMRMLDEFAAALETMASAPATIVADMAIRPSALVGEDLRLPTVLTPARIASVIEADATAPAVLSGSDHLSYAELDEAARSLAARLRAVGVGPGDRVAVVLPRSVELPVTILATWMIGASYVPIDIAQPAARVTELLSLADVSAAVSSNGGHAGLTEVTTVHVDRPEPSILPLRRVHEHKGSDEAYVIFTSGSTGRPKGVPISHANLAASLDARLQFYPEPVERYLLMSSAGFDSSVAGLFWTLACGGELIVPTDDQVHDIDALLELAGRTRPSHTLMVPSLYGALLQRSSGAIPGLRTVIVAGEACPGALVGAHFAVARDVQLVNEYGPTEATVWATVHRLTTGDAIVAPIGTPIPGMIAEVVGHDGRAVPIDAAGELWLSGPGVADGYLNGNEGGAFVERNGQQTYRTGDLVVRRSSGLIEFLGRVDGQLSVGGVRIEPNEIEQTLMALHGVGGAVVDVRGRHLVAWIETTIDLGETELRERLAERLPATHVPARIITVGTLPRNANGKIDRNLVDDLVVTAVHSETAGVQTADPVVDRVSAIFSQAFDGADYGPDDDFFDAGGDSLRAVALVSLLENEFGRRVAIGELVDAPTPRALAGRLGGPGRGSGEVDMHDAAGLVEWLRSTGSKTPLVVLPPGGGNLLRYAALVKNLDPEVPVVGIRLPGADARSEIVETIVEQAEVMLAALDSAVRSGPYRLLGWSTGGLLAWEIARLLRDRGDEVEIVVLVDTLMAGIRLDDSGSIADKYADMLRTDGIGAVVGEGTSRIRERVNFAIARRRYRMSREAGEAPSLEDAERQLGPIIRRAALGYTPQRFDLPVTYLAASESDHSVTIEPWTELQGPTNPLDVVVLDGVHFIPEERCIIGPERVAKLVAALEARLDG